jgi:uncharacterized protein (DUF885 family)
MAVVPEDDSLAAPIAAYLDDFFAMHPYQAVKAGLHRFDGFVAHWTPTTIARRLAQLDRHQAALTELAAAPLERALPLDDPPSLSAGDRARWDARLAMVHLRSERFFWEVWRPQTTNPLTYIPVLDVSPYIRRDYAPLADRVRALTRHCAALPDLLAEAEAMLRERLPLVIVQQSSATFESLAHFHLGELAAVVQPVGDAAILADFQRANHAAVVALRAFAAALRARVPLAMPDLALGADILRGMLATQELVDLPFDDLIALGEADLARNQARITEVAARLGLAPAAAMADLGRRHPPAHLLLHRTRLLCETLRQFCIDRALVTVPGEGRCQVHETLPYMRNGSAYMDVPGPFDAPGSPAYFYLTLPDPAWSHAQQEAWLAKQSIPGLANTCAHEAWPGHFLQHLHLLRAPTAASKIFTSVSFVEGWAHYAEELINEAGYGADDPRYALQHLSMALLRDCRFLVALRLHAGQMSIDAAASFIARTAYFTPLRAQQEAQRGARAPGYLNYTLGKLLLLRLRDDLRAAYPAWSTRQVHDALLTFGAPPIPLLREMVLNASPNSPTLVPFQP